MMFKREQLYNASGKARSTSIFIEYDSKGIMTLRHKKPNGVPSLRDLYIQYCSEDPTEYSFAIEVFGDTFFWFNLRERKFIQDLLPEWEHMASLARKSKAFKALISEVELNGRGLVTAAKYLIDKSPTDKGKPKAVKEKEDKEIFSHVDEDLKRLREQGLIN